MDRTYRGLGFDPTPGNLDAVTRTIAQFTAAAEALDAVPAALRRAGELAQDWHGDAAEAFRARLRDTPAGLDARARTLRRAADALDRWADVLAANQRRAEELDERAVRLRRRIDLARDEVQDRQNALDLAATPAAAAAASTDLAVVTTLVTDLQTALDEILAKARTLARDHLRAADTVADELAEVRGEDVPPREHSGPRLAATAGEALARASHTSSALAALLTPAERPMQAPPRAAGAFAAALSSSGGTTSR